MLQDILEKRQCFKLVCGAGNEDTSEVEKLVTIYSMAGCQFFDVCAKPEIVSAAKRGIQRAGIKENRYICVSVGIDGDPHITKAIIDTTKCVNCGECKKVCPHDAINENIQQYEIIKERCIGCNQCKKNCKNNAIKMISQVQNYSEVLPKIIKMGIDCIEFHAISTNENDVDEKWEQINQFFN